MSGIKMTNVSGEKYVPYSERNGNESVVYFTRDLSAAGLKKIYEKVNGNMIGKAWIHTSSVV